MPKVTVTINSRVSPAVFDKIKAVAEKNRRSLSAEIELAIEKYCDSELKRK